MARFDDYHRTVVGYHGTRLSAALRMVNRIEGFRWSKRDYDWLGHGIYFWEYCARPSPDVCEDSPGTAEAEKEFDLTGGSPLMNCRQSWHR